MKQMRVCSNHLTTPTPLIWTFAFNGAEYWCPHCGQNYGMLGVGKRVNPTPELEAKLANDEQRSADFLAARSRLICTSVEYNGVMMDPKDLPERERQEDLNTVRKWFYEVNRLNGKEKE